MNKLIVTFCTMLCGILISCSGTGKPNDKMLSVEKTDSCQLDSKNSYEVYIPAINNLKEKFPLLVIIDAHGNGRFALNKFKQASDSYPAVLVASNTIKNGFSGYDQAIETLINDVRQKYPVGKTVFITGFSGGARMALGYALAHPINGLILCGALASPDQINALRCPVLSISGMDDFNFIETAQYLFQESTIPVNLKIELTNASHSWPDSLMLANAFGFLRLSCDAAELPTPTKLQLKDYCTNQQSRIDMLQKQGDFLKAALIARNMATTEVFDKDKFFSATYNELKTSNEFITQISQLGKCLNNEMSVRQPYMAAFSTKDSIWWKNEIKTTDEKIKTEQDAFTRDMHRRIKAFWGIACYSLGKQAIMQQNSDELNKIVTVYRMLEPENPDMFYYAAFPYYWKGNNEATISLLKKAIKAGFTDMNQLKTDFPEPISSKLN